MDTKTLMMRLEEADKLLRKGDLADARAVYVELVSEAPVEMQPQLYHRIQRVDELVDPQQQVASARAQVNATEQAIAEAAYNEGRIDEALDLYARIVDARPDDVLARERMTELLAEKARLIKDRQKSQSRSINLNDISNAESAGTQESGPLGVALKHAQPVPAADPVEDAEDVPMMDESDVMDDMPEMGVADAAPAAAWGDMADVPPAEFDPFVVPRSAPPRPEPEASFDVEDMAEPGAPEAEPFPVAAPEPPPPVEDVPPDPVPAVEEALPEPVLPVEEELPPPTEAVAAVAPAPSPLPDDPVAMLQELLARIQANRRPLP